MSYLSSFYLMYRLFLLIYAFFDENCPEIVAYISYFISAYALTVACARMPGILYQSKWLFAMAGYNTILSGMRFVLVYRDQINLHKESDYERKIQGLHSYKACGWLMLLLNSAISVIVVMVVFDNQTIVYPGFMIYAIAAYSFYCLTMGIINLVKYWHRDNPVFSAVKRIGMAKALVSIFTLQVAMITQFGESGGLDYRMANGATGFAVCIMITVMAVLMLKGVKTDFAYMKQEDTKVKE